MAKPKRGRGDARDYHPEFERLWEGCANRRGNKLPAFKAWQKFKPPLDLTLSRFALWATTSQWLDGFAPHLSTWLNEKGWENEPGPAEFKPRGVPRATDTRCTWHQKCDDKPSRYPTASCDRCQHFAARNGTRSSEPTPMDLPDWMVKPPPALTDEQRAEIAELTKRNGSVNR